MDIDLDKLMSYSEATRKLEGEGRSDIVLPKKYEDFHNTDDLPNFPRAEFEGYYYHIYNLSYDVPGIPSHWLLPGPEMVDGLFINYQRKFKVNGRWDSSTKQWWMVDANWEVL